MNIQKINKAIDEAERFLFRAIVAKRQLVIDFNSDAKRLALANINVYANVNKENAACKRASMDLTRALADMRR